jgi:nitroreductase
MNTLEAIAKRKSTRAYAEKQVSEEDLQRILQAGFAAPVAMAKYDSLHITVIRNEKVIAKINAMTAEMFSRRMGVKKNTDFGAKTMLLVSTVKDGLSPEMLYANVGIVVENMILAATDLGIDSVILGGAPSIVAQDEALVRSLDIPEGFRPVLGAFLGYAEAEEPPKKHDIAVNFVL